jgi:hydroxymethylglutaryl-CoA lyase
MQGLQRFIPTSKKIEYLDQLLQVGFDTIDFGSFVSPKAIPQMRDTADVLSQINMSQTSSKLLAIVANLRGAEDACQFEEINYLGFPLSISEQFQQRNTKKSIQEALVLVEQIQNLIANTKKRQVVYVSMGFGNPYGEAFNEEIVAGFIKKLVDLDIEIISLADTIGSSDKQMIKSIFETSITAYPTTEIGAHFHSTPDATIEKVETAYRAGCRRFDSAIKGFGGCPMAKDELTGNIATEKLWAYFDSIEVDLALDRVAFQKSVEMSLAVFPN